MFMRFQWEFDYGYDNENYNENEKDLATVFMNLKAENCPAHTYEPATGYQTANNNEQQWQSASDTFPQRVLVYDTLDNNFMYSNDENYLLPATIGTYKHITDIHHRCMPLSNIFTNNLQPLFYRPVIPLSYFSCYTHLTYIYVDS